MYVYIYTHIYKFIHIYEYTCVNALGLELLGKGVTHLSRSHLLLCTFKSQVCANLGDEIGAR